MSDSTLQDIIAELTDAETKLKNRIEQLFGKVGTSDFNAEYVELQDVLSKLNAFVAIPPVETPVENASK